MTLIGENFVELETMRPYQLTADTLSYFPSLKGKNSQTKTSQRCDIGLNYVFLA